ncbi:MAG: T9SS type A sorting domain-containing protein [bacterium]|nr:MAG: T9SS type A sorting domain-containing protein [bacterium]
MKYFIAILFTQILCLSSLLAQGNPWIPKTDMPTGRMTLSSSAVEGKIYVMGGHVNGAIWGDPASPKVDKYDPATDTWDTTTADMPRGRNSFASVVVNGKIYAIGGQSSAGTTAESSFWEYDPLTDTWDTTKAQMPSPRVGLSASVVDGKIYVIGGWNFSAPKYKKAVWVYDPLTNTWDDTTSMDMPTPRAYLSTSVIDRKIYAFGGLNNDATFNGLTTLEIYDPATDTWDTTKADMPAGRVYLKSGSADSMIYIFGGSTNPNHLPASTVWEYNPAADTFKEVSPMPMGIMQAAASEIGGIIYHFGGTDTTLSTPAKVSSKVFEWNPFVAIEKGDKNLTGVFSLHQNYPNPFNPSTTIEFDLPKSSQVTLKIFNILGEGVATLVSDRLSAGSYSYEWDASNLASGIYLYRLQAGDPSQSAGQGYFETRKMILMR